MVSNRIVVSRWTLLWASIILIAGLGASGLVAYTRLNAGPNPYESSIAPVVEDYNGIIRRWNSFVDEFNQYAPSAWANRTSGPRVGSP